MKAIIQGGPKVLAALEKFYTWLRDQEFIDDSAIKPGCTCDVCQGHREDRDKYGFIVAKMQTLFAGLIEFDEKQE